MVARIVVVVPQMGGQPRTGHRAEVVLHGLVAERCGEAEGIGGDGRGPPPRTEIRLRRHRPAFHLRPHIVHHRLHAFQEVILQGRPVVHLDVDVVVVVAVPWPVDIVEPKSLEIGRQVVA